jgi:hypothetical protein
VPCGHGGDGASTGRTCAARRSSNELCDDMNGRHVYRIAAAPSKTAGVVLFFDRERVTTMCNWCASNVVTGLISFFGLFLCTVVVLCPIARLSFSKSALDVRCDITTVYPGSGCLERMHCLYFLRRTSIGVMHVRGLVRTRTDLSRVDSLTK